MFPSGTHRHQFVAVCVSRMLRTFSQASTFPFHKHPFPGKQNRNSSRPMEEQLWIICRQRYRSCVCAKTLILKPEFSVFRAGEPKASPSCTWSSLQGKKEGKCQWGVHAPVICGGEVHYLTLTEWKFAKLFKYREFSSDFHGPLSSVSFCIRNRSDKYPHNLHLNPYKSLSDRKERSS